MCKDLQKHTRKLPGKDLSRLRSFYKQKSYDVIRKKTLILGVENVLVEIRKDQEIMRRKRTSTVFRRETEKVRPSSRRASSSFKGTKREGVSRGQDEEPCNKNRKM